MTTDFRQDLVDVVLLKKSSLTFHPEVYPNCEGEQRLISLEILKVINLLLSSRVVSPDTPLGVISTKILRILRNLLLTNHLFVEWERTVIEIRSSCGEFE